MGAGDNVSSLMNVNRFRPIKIVSFIIVGLTSDRSLDIYLYLFIYLLSSLITFLCPPSNLISFFSYDAFSCAFYFACMCGPYEVAIFFKIIPDNYCVKILEQKSQD